MTTPTDAVITYLSGELSDEAQRAFEERLFSGDLDGTELVELSELAIGLREAAFLGILSVTTSRLEMERLRGLGYRIVECILEPGRTATADLSGDFDLLFLEYRVDLAGVTRLDIEVLDTAGNLLKRNVEVPFRPGDASVTGFCARELALVGVREHPDGLVNRFISVEPDGDRVVAEFTARVRHA